MPLIQSPLLRCTGGQTQRVNIVGFQTNPRMKRRISKLIKIIKDKTVDVEYKFTKVDSCRKRRFYRLHFHLVIAIGLPITTNNGNRITKQNTQKLKDYDATKADNMQICIFTLISPGPQSICLKWSIRYITWRSVRCNYIRWMALHVVNRTP
jgi:hypothetical protein